MPLRNAAPLLALILLVMSAKPLGAAQEVELSSMPRWGEGQRLTGELSFPAGPGPFPAVVMMHGCSGLVEVVRNGLRSHAQFFNDQGFAVLILDSFGPRDLEGGKVCESLELLGQAAYYRIQDAFGALHHLRGLEKIDGENIFLMGQSNGGSAAIVASQPKGQYAANSDLTFRAVAAFYPWCGAFTNTHLNSPLIVLAGDADDWTPPKACLDQKERLVGTDYEVVIYPGAHHSFDLGGVKVQTYKGHTVGANPEALADSRERVIAFFRRYIPE